MKHLGYRYFCILTQYSFLMLFMIYLTPLLHLDTLRETVNVFRPLSNYTTARERIYTINLSLIGVHIRPQSAP